MLCINKGGNLVFGIENGDTVFMRTGETFDVPQEIYEKHKDKLKPIKALTADEKANLEQKQPEIQTTQQRQAMTRPGGGGRKRGNAQGA